MLSNMAVGMYYASPMVAVYFFFSTQHQIAVGYYLFIYYTWGNLIYGVSVYEMLGLAIDRPLHALLNLEYDVEQAENHKDYNLETYLKIFDQEEVVEKSSYMTSSLDLPKKSQDEVKANLLKAKQKLAKIEEEHND